MPGFIYIYIYIYIYLLKKKKKIYIYYLIFWLYQLLTPKQFVQSRSLNQKLKNCGKVCLLNIGFFFFFFFEKTKTHNKEEEMKF